MTDAYRLPPLPASWRRLGAAMRSPSFRDLRAFLSAEAREHVVCPPPAAVFRALELTNRRAVPVVILGQDPYPGPGQAHGLCFSVPRGVKPPPSLRNIFRELEADLGHGPPAHGCLEAWARQGVLLLNTVLTVRAGTANSHRGRGWERFTAEVMRCVVAKRTPVAFALWGAQAQQAAGLIDTRRHAIVRAAHPSPLSAHAGFLGSRPFSRINAALDAAGRTPVEWRLPEGV
jgi:uracil-DNA glycosylase